jgi:uncharacterized protein (UPF0276 family)
MNPLSLGVGLDTPWGSPRGFQSSVGSALGHFLEKNGGDFETFFFSFQRRSYGALRSADYLQGFQDIYEQAKKFARTVNLHHTMLNLGSTLPYHREHIIEVTNELSDRIPFGWINEDVGIWFLEGKSIPYPLPPILTEESLRICKETVRHVMRELKTPLSIEFPGITDGASFQVGHLDLFEFFADLADGTQSLVTLDTGHLLGWEWMQGRRKDEMYRHLENFPFAQVVEIHMAGSESKDGAFIDRHHGILLDDQFEILDFLVPRCPNLKVVTYEDPKFDLQGNLILAAKPSFEKLKETVDQWKRKKNLQTSSSEQIRPQHSLFSETIFF